MPIGLSYRVESAKSTSVLVVGSVSQSLYWQEAHIRREQQVTGRGSSMYAGVLTTGDPSGFFVALHIAV